MPTEKRKLNVTVHHQPPYLSKEWYEYCDCHGLTPYPIKPHEGRAYAHVSPRTDCLEYSSIIYIDGQQVFISHDQLNQEETK